jgi:hypothetical protein
MMNLEQSPQSILYINGSTCIILNALFISIFAARINCGNASLQRLEIEESDQNDFIRIEKSFYSFKIYYIPGHMMSKFSMSI